MNQTPGFWDASAVVPLCIQQKTTRAARSAVRRFAPVVWWGTLTEVYSAFCRLHREREITESGKRGAVARLQFLSRSWREVVPTEPVHDLALQSLERYSLKAADSLQLAASLIWCDQRPKKRTFISGDQRLADVARSAGFSVVELF